MGRACTSMHRTLAIRGASLQWRHSRPYTINRDTFLHIAIHGAKAIYIASPLALADVGGKAGAATPPGMVARSPTLRPQLVHGSVHRHLRIFGSETLPAAVKTNVDIARGIQGNADNTV